MFEELNQHRAAVEEQIQKGFEIGFTGGELEKAHKVGDIHPNGKWVWTQLPSGKYDWRVIKKTSAPSGSAVSSTAQKQTSEGKKSWDNLSDFYKNGSDERKMWMEWDRFQKTGDPNIISSIRKILEKKFPNVSSWKQYTPNTNNSSKLVAVGADGKEIASIDFGGKGVDLPKLQTFMDKCSAVKKKEDHITISPNHPALGALKGVNAMKEYLTTFNSKYTDMSKVEVLRTPKGNWEVHYDGDRLGIFAGDQVPEGTAKKMGWLKTDAKDLIGYKRDVEEEAKKKEGSVAQKKNETNAEAGIRVFNSLSKEKQAILLGKLKKESERFLKNGMKLNEIIGEVEEYRDNNIDFDEEMFDIARDLGVKHNEAYWVMKHAANLEIKRLEGLANDKKKANKTADDSPKETRIIFLNGKPYYIWNEGKDFRGSSQNPKDLTNTNYLRKFDSSQGFESIDDVEEYVQTHFGKKFDAKDPYQVHAVNYLLGQPRWTMKSAERWVANLPEKKVKELADKDM